MEFKDMIINKYNNPSLFNWKGFLVKKGTVLYCPLTEQFHSNLKVRKNK